MRPLKTVVQSNDIYKLEWLICVDICLSWVVKFSSVWSCPGTFDVYQHGQLVLLDPAGVPWSQELRQRKIGASLGCLQIDSQAQILKCPIFKGYENIFSKSSNKTKKTVVILGTLITAKFDGSSHFVWRLVVPNLGLCSPQTKWPPPPNLAIIKQAHVKKNKPS